MKGSEAVQRLVESGALVNSTDYPVVEPVWTRQGNRLRLTYVSAHKLAYGLISIRSSNDKWKVNNTVHIKGSGCAQVKALLQQPFCYETRRYVVPELLCARCAAWVLKELPRLQLQAALT